MLNELHQQELTNEGIVDIEESVLSQIDTTQDNLQEYIEREEHFEDVSCSSVDSREEDLEAIKQEVIIINPFKKKSYKQNMNVEEEKNNELLENWEEIKKENEWEFIEQQESMKVLHLNSNLQFIPEKQFIDFDTQIKYFEVFIMKWKFDGNINKRKKENTRF